jgi:hypothetical protein
MRISWSRSRTSTVGKFLLTSISLIDGHSLILSPNERSSAGVFAAKYRFYGFLGFKRRPLREAALQASNLRRWTIPASINRSPLAMGLLTGKFNEKSRLNADDVRGIPPEWLRYFDKGNPKPEWLERVAAIRKILTSDGRTLAQGALGRIWTRSPQTIPIPGFRTVKQVEENVAALQFGPLSDEALREIASLLAT